MLRKRWFVGLLVGMVILAGFTVAYMASQVCVSAFWTYGIKTATCPSGRLRQTATIRAMNLRRGGVGLAMVSANAVFATEEADEVLSASVPELDATLSIVDARGQETPLPVEQKDASTGKRPKRQRYLLSLPVQLPETLTDGDYLLRAKVKTRVGESQVDLALPLYAPARVHVVTDRPLYEPGHRVRYRALVLRGRDLTPIDHRPGVFEVKDPGGNVVLEEKAPAGEWGVVASDFLLDDEAEVGTWTVVWRSGEDRGQASFRVESFTLPRFRVEAAADQPFYTVGKTPKMTGSVVYSSGAPVQGAKVTLSWQSSGAWPPPSEWLTRTLPKEAVADAQGRFTLTLPQVPEDLQGQATLIASLSAVDSAGDRVEGQASVLLSEHGLKAEAVTPLAGGLVGGSNNRVYLRVTTADGRSLPGASILVRRAWMEDAQGIQAELDEDSVARIQIDPGPPVNIVIPAPVKRKDVDKDRGAVSRSQTLDLVTGEDATLDDQVELDRWIAVVKPCGKWITEDETTASVGLRVSAAGAIVESLASGRLSRCVLERLKGRRLPVGNERLYEVEFTFTEPDLPRLDLEVKAAIDDETPEPLTELFEEAARDARDCLPRDLDGELPWTLAWRLRPGAAKPSVVWMRGPAADDGLSMTPALDRCILSAVNRAIATRIAPLSEPADGERLGVVRYTLVKPEGDQEEAPSQPRIMRGYELLVSATLKGQPVGQTRMRLSPGVIPRLSVRAEPVLTSPGSTVSIKVLRGPGYRGRPPRRLEVHHFGGVLDVLKLPEEAEGGEFSYKIPADKKGWFEFRAEGERALVFVRTAGTLTVQVEPEKPSYPPGALAKLLIRTITLAGPIQAAVGLFGLDESLAQLATLESPDSLGALQPKVVMVSKAFEVLDGQALALGRIRGGHAAEATVLRVQSIPKPDELDRVIHAQATTIFDANVELTDRFYRVLPELHRRVRTWEKTAPASELMKPETLAALWIQALAACEARGEPVKDAFDRTLRLHRLPSDLLAMTDPRQVVAMGTRLPEDVEDWARWVERRKP